MAHFITGVVTEVVSHRPGLQRIRVDGAPAVVLTDLTGPVSVGDEVVVNATAAHWALGSSEGGIVHWNLRNRTYTSPSAPGTDGPVLVKARYTPAQVARYGAEEGGTAMPARCAVPVIALHLHSQLEAVTNAYAQSSGQGLAYVMTDSAGLALVLSDTVARLREAGSLTATVTAGQSFGGDLEAVSVASAIQLAAGSGAGAVAVGPGPGVVGSASPLGFGGMELLEVAATARALGTVAVLAVRYSEAETRPRHQGVSHHCRTVLWASPAAFVVALPDDADGDFVGPPHSVMRASVPRPETLVSEGTTTMGRTVAEDPEFFRYAAAAGVVAAAIPRGDLRAAGSSGTGPGPSR